MLGSSRLIFYLAAAECGFDFRLVFFCRFLGLFPYFHSPEVVFFQPHLNGVRDRL